MRCHNKFCRFKFSASIQERIEQLVCQKQVDALNLAEQEELEKYLTYDLLIGLAKVRAVQHLAA